MNQADISDLFLKIKGIGPWTLGIIQMFYIGQEDIYLTGDLGIKKAGLDFFKSDNSLPVAPNSVSIKSRSSSSSMMPKPSAVAKSFSFCLCLALASIFLFIFSTFRRIRAQQPNRSG